MKQQNYKIGQSNEVSARNYTDENDNPAGGYAHGPGMCIAWQDGPRERHPATGDLRPANGAFVEDALVAARQRLVFFQHSKFACEKNAEAMRHIDAAITALWDRALERESRGVLGSNAV